MRFMRIILSVGLLFVFSAQLNALRPVISYGMSTNQNKRPYQEDRFAHAFVNGGPFFGIYDGHGGDKVSSYLQKNLHQQVLAKTRFEGLKYMFAQAEDYALKNCADGSTALVAQFGTDVDKNNLLYCAWVGDTRAVLEENGSVVFETRDHKPDSPQELTRIKSLGGSIEKYGVWRVGGLAISRSIGDADIKKKFPGQIIAEPEVARVRLNENNHFLIMASDGLWDVITSSQAVEIVSQKLERADNLSDIAQYLENEAMVRGSQDNITVCIIKFDWQPKSLLTKSYERSVEKATFYSLMVRFFDWLRGARSVD